MRLMRFVHFNANWLDFGFVGCKNRDFYFVREKRLRFFRKMCIFAFQTDELWNPTTISKIPNPQ